MKNFITGTSPLHNYINKNSERFLNELIDLLKIPSISANSEYDKDTRHAARKVADLLKEAGVEKVEIIETPGHPIVYAEKITDVSKPTVLVYGHYDVQPADPLDLWDAPPFEPVIKNEAIYARGSADDKGQVMMHIKAFEAMHAMGDLPCNVKFMIEGEEEVGSNNLEDFVKKNTEKLKSDVILISDTSILANDTPSITVGLKGLAYLEVEVTGPNRDLHSGVYGGAVDNPINVLCEMISKLKNPDGVIQIPGFYDKVIEMNTDYRKSLNEAPFDLEEYKKDLGINAVHGEKNYTTLERAGIRPTLDVNGIWGGYTGEGAKTVLPSKAYAKISMRLVPDQDDKEISKLFREYFESIAPDSVKVNITTHHGGQPYVTPVESKAFTAASKAFKEEWGKPAIPTRDGGSIPIVALFKEVLKVDSVLMGFGLDSDAIHSPNEKYGLFNFYKGIATIPLFHKYFAQK